MAFEGTMTLAEANSTVQTLTHFECPSGRVDSSNVTGAVPALSSVVVHIEGIIGCGVTALVVALGQTPSRNDNLPSGAISVCYLNRKSTVAHNF